MAMGRLDEDSLYEALSLQQALPQSRIEPANVKRAIASLLPARVSARHKLVPIKLDLGTLFVAGPELPTPNCAMKSRRFTSARDRVSSCHARKLQQLVSELLQA